MTAEKVVEVDRMGDDFVDSGTRGHILSLTSVLALLGEEARMVALLHDDIRHLRLVVGVQ